ncbi:GntR family transcriptional regulator [Rhodobacter sp. KR11]|uniref:FadR/GntR family transcriptional regulator n=1 Tax=Rhodobacter sp. KR11 TaxID=2974588 RepID=UPI002223854D|nr:GntR family transcriptional regulator [Rhodobacter sp. KR11]MCW1918930.1 GntR family transcriptional regulator [Rhodobacter sp. KR11]
MPEPGHLIRSLTGRPAARNFHSFVINEIGMGVASGSFPAGSTLPGDAEMIARYDVSRTVLREAVKTLEAKGLVEARAKVGTRVLPRNRWNLFDRQVLFWIFHAAPEPGFTDALQEVRAGLEMQAVALAARHAHAEQLRMMRYWLAQAQISSGMVENYGLAVFEIHRLVAEASQNPILRSSTGLSEFALALALRGQMAQGEADFAGARTAHHEALIAALDQGQADQAGAAMAALLAIDRGEKA